MNHQETQHLPFDFSCSGEAIAGLKPALMQALFRVAEEYSTATSTRLTVTSASRNLRKMASLMAGFSIAQLEGMYCRNGYPQYIRSIADERSRLGRLLTDDETYVILQNRTEGYISTHLFGAAVDIAVENLKNKDLLCSLLEANGFRTLDETSLGIQCIHATFKDIPKEIVRE